MIAVAKRGFDRTAIRAAALTKEKRRFRLKTFLAILAGAAIAAGSAAGLNLAQKAAARNTLFEVKAIKLDGNKRVDGSRLKGLLEAGISGNIFTRDIGKVTALIERIPAVESASIRLKLPDTAEVTIVERKPAAVAAVNGTYYLMDASMHLIEEARTGLAGLPLIKGVRGAEKAGDRVADERLHEAFEVAALFQLDSYWHDKAVSVDLSVPGTVEVITSSGMSVKFGPDRAGRREKFYEYLSARRISAELGERFTGYDLSFDGQVVGIGAGEANNETKKAGGSI